MKRIYKRFLSLLLCLTLWFSLFISFQNNFVSAYPIEIFFLEPQDGDTVRPNENGSVLIKAEYTGSECPYYFEIFIDGTRRAWQYTPGLCIRSVSYYWSTLEEVEGPHSLHAYVTYQDETVIAESEIIEVYLDNPEEPQIQITDPSGTEPIGNGVNIVTKVTIDSTYYYDTRVAHYVDGSYVGSEGNPTSQVNNTLYYTYYWDSTSVPDGQHTILARVFDQFGRKNEDSIVVMVQQNPANQSPTACFSYNPHNPDIGQTISFDASCSSDPDNDPLDYSWSFGDGSAGSGISINHSYSSEGTYHVRLTATDSKGGSDYIIRNVTVTSGGTNQPPVADAGPDQSVTVGEAAYFDGSSSYDPDGTIVSYFWDFGDGETSNEIAPTHIYYSEGSYYVTLTVTDDNSISDSDTAKVTVSSGGGNHSPTACFAYNPPNPNVGQTISFDASCSFDPDNDPLDYSWSFGDGYSGSGITISHSYSSSGIYQITLIVDDGQGGTNSTSQIVNIQSTSYDISILEPEIDWQNADEDIVNLKLHIKNNGNSWVNDTTTILVLENFLPCSYYSSYWNYNFEVELIDEMNKGDVKTTITFDTEDLAPNNTYTINIFLTPVLGYHNNKNDIYASISTVKIFYSNKSKLKQIYCKYDYYELLNRFKRNDMVILTSIQKLKEFKNSSLSESSVEDLLKKLTYVAHKQWGVIVNLPKNACDTWENVDLRLENTIINHFDWNYMENDYYLMIVGGHEIIPFWIKKYEVGFWPQIEKRFFHSDIKYATMGNNLGTGTWISCGRIVGDNIGDMTSLIENSINKKPDQSVFTTDNSQRYYSFNITTISDIFIPNPPSSRQG